MMYVIPVDLLTEDSQVYCYSCDFTSAIVSSDHSIANSIHSLTYEEIPLFLQTDDWKQPSEDIT
jgi:hypothetical protein